VDAKGPQPPLELLTPEDVILDARAADKWEAIRLVGERLASRGRVTPEYVEAMMQREREFSTYVGNGVAIPHGVAASRQFILHPGLSIAQFPQGVDWGGEQVAYLVVGIAAVGEEHIDLLARIAERCQDPSLVRRLATVPTAEELLAVFR